MQKLRTILCGCFGVGDWKRHDEVLPGDKSKCSTASTTQTATPHPSWGNSSRIERGFDQVGSETVLGNVPEDDCLSTSGRSDHQFSSRSLGLNEKATSTTGEPSQGQSAVQIREAENTQPSKLYANDVLLPALTGEQSSGMEQSPQPPSESRVVTAGSGAKAVSGPLQRTTGDALRGDSAIPQCRSESHEATVSKLEAQIEQFGREKQGYDLIGVAQAMVGFEKMCMEEAERVRYNSIRMQAIGMRPESASIYMNMEKEDWKALNSMTPPAARKASSLPKRLPVLGSSAHTEAASPVA